MKRPLAHPRAPHGTARRAEPGPGRQAQRATRLWRLTKRLASFLGHVTSDANDRYRALVEAIGEMVWTTTAEGEGGGPRPAWCAYTGQSEAESQGFGWS